MLHIQTGSLKRLLSFLIFYHLFIYLDFLLFFLSVLPNFFSDSSSMTSLSSIHQSSGSTSGAPYNSFSLSPETTVTLNHLVKGNQMVCIPPQDNAEMLPEAGTSTPHTPSSAGQSFLEETFQTLETATGLTTSLFGETYCLQKTED
ncbi:hypothetical protein SRHO_G00276600 [Serrasalmus rhombeus]